MDSSNEQLQQRLRALVGRLHTVREEEAKRIARELHDGLGQQLTALGMALTDFEGILPAATAEQRDQMAGMQAMVQHTIGIVQTIAGELRLGQLDLLGLTAAIDWHVKEFSRQSSIPCRIARLDEVESLSDAQSTAIFRILQEALTNVVRHAAASEVTICLHADPHEVALRISDNGRGIAEADLNAENSLGLLGMRERAQIVGAELTLTGAPGRGTIVLVRMPLVAAAVLQ